MSLETNNPIELPLESFNTLFKWSFSTSSVLSIPDCNSFTLVSFISKPTTGYFFANSTAKGKPT